jgi:hypothetical protein
MREVLARAIDRGEIDGDIDIDHLEQFFLGPIYYRAVLDGQELDDDTIAAFRRLALAHNGPTPQQHEVSCPMSLVAFSCR